MRHGLMTVQERQRTNAAPAGRESHDAIHGFPVVVRPLTALVDGGPVLPGFRLDFRSIR